MARVAALRAGLPVTTAGLTVNRYCNSGLQAIVQAAHMIDHEGADVVIGGGVESITMMDRDSSPEPVAAASSSRRCIMAMGETAEIVAKRYGVTREAQDEYSLVSQQRTARAQGDGFFAGEIAPIRSAAPCSIKKTGERLAKRTAWSTATNAIGPTRRSTGLRKLPPVFDTASGQGSVTAGNSSQLSDGASATLVMSARARRGAGPRAAAGVPRLCRRRAASPTRWASDRSSPCRSCSKHAGCQVDDIDVWELNEAFASQVVYCRDRLGMPMDRLNPNGGSIAIGHPFGMTGSRLVGTHRRRDASPRRSLWRRHDVRRRRTGRGGAVRTRMSSTLSAALNPSSIAIIGASDNPNKVGGRPLLYLSRFGFKGRVYPINPTRDRVQGFRSYPDLAPCPKRRISRSSRRPGNWSAGR